MAENMDKEERQREIEKINQYKKELITQKETNIKAKADMAKKNKEPIGALIPDDSAKFAERMKALNKPTWPKQEPKATEAKKQDDSIGIVTSTMQQENSKEDERLKKKADTLNKYKEATEVKDEQPLKFEPSIKPQKFLSEEEKKEISKKIAQQNRILLEEKSKKVEREKKEYIDFMKQLKEKAESAENEIKQNKSQINKELQEQMTKERENVNSKKKEMEYQRKEQLVKEGERLAQEKLKLETQEKQSKEQMSVSMKKYMEDLSKQKSQVNKQKAFVEEGTGLKLESYSKAKK